MMKRVVSKLREVNGTGSEREREFEGMMRAKRSNCAGEVRRTCLGSFGPKIPYGRIEGESRAISRNGSVATRFRDVFSDFVKNMRAQSGPVRNDAVYRPG